MKIKNIAFIHSDFPAGGAEKITTYIAHSLSNAGYRIYVFVKSVDYNLLTEYDQNITFIEVPGKNIYVAESENFILDQIRTLHIDLFVCAHLYLPYLQRIKNETPARLIYAHHSIPFWEAKNKLSMGEYASRKSLWKRLEWYLVRLPKYKIPGYLIKRSKKSYIDTYNIVDGYAVLCNAYAEEIASVLHIDPSQSKLFTLNNPCLPLKQQPVLQKKKQVVYVGRLSYPDKRVDRLLLIWAKIEADFPDWELLIYGTGEDETDLKKLASEQKLRNIRFMGYQKETAPIYNEASVLCLTSAIEGWGLVLTEAQQHGVFAMAFDCAAGVHEILAPNQEKEFLVTPYSLNEYARKLKFIMTHYHDRTDLREKMTRYSERYSLEKVQNQWLSMIGHLEKMPD